MAESTGTRARSLGWACYLACSWTWCIGMFLPVLMVRDYGLLGFLVFAVPNVLGAGAFAWALARPGSSEAMVGTHRLAIGAFSAVTVAFHAFFLTWFVVGLAPHVGLANDLTRVLPFAIALVIAALTSAWVRSARVLIGAVIVLAISLISWIVMEVAPTGDGPDPSSLDLTGWEARSGVLPVMWLAPVTALGFALCPYFDPTFHRARQALSAREAKIAFGVGFGVLFLAMILFTLAYSGYFLKAQERAFVSWAAIAIWTHVLCQSVFTMLLHANEGGLLFAHHQAGRRWSMLMPLVIGAGVAAALFVASPADRTQAAWANDPYAFRSGELIYRLFMSFYGLVFPAYAWIVMIPTRDGHSGGASIRGRWKVRVFWMAVGIAAPMYWMGFIERREGWLGAGVLVVLLARLAVKGGTPRRRRGEKEPGLES